MSRLIWMLLLITLAQYSLQAQEQDLLKPCFRWDGNTATFEPPRLVPVPKERGYTKETWANSVEHQARELKACKAIYEKYVYEQVDKLHHCFRLISNPEKASRIKRAAKGTALELFKDRSGNAADKVNFYGYMLDENNDFTLQSRDLEQYIEMLIVSADSSQLYSICWGIPQIEMVGDTVIYPLEFKYGSANPIEKDTLSTDTVNRFYLAYKATMPIREAIASRRKTDAGLIDKEVCKEISFQLRFVERLDTTGVTNWEDRYYWQASFFDIKKASNENDCRMIKDIPCVKDTLHIKDTATTPPIVVTPPVACKRLVPAWTYAIPGVGFRYFQKNEKVFPHWLFVTGAFATATGAAVHYKLNADKSYQVHLKETVLENRDQYYDRAENDQERFLWSAGSALFIWAASDVLVYLIDGRKYKKCKKYFEAPEKEAPPSTFSIHPALFPTQEGKHAIGFSFVKRF